MRIYVATSWRNRHTDEVLRHLRSLGHEAYDFRAEGFSWRDAGVDGDRALGAKAIAGLLNTPLAREGFAKDMSALRACDVVVLVLPAGRSAHLEAGWAVGASKRLVVYQPEAEKPDLMHAMAHGIAGDLAGLTEALADLL